MILMFVLRDVLHTNTHYNPLTLISSHFSKTLKSLCSFVSLANIFDLNAHVMVTLDVDDESHVTFTARLRPFTKARKHEF